MDSSFHMFYNKIAFLHVMKRLVAKRRYPVRIVSDNATHVRPNSTANESPHPIEIVFTTLICREGTWKLGKIVAMNGGSDEAISTVGVKITNGRILDRSVNLISPLEVDDRSDSTELGRVDSLAAQKERMEIKQKSARADGAVSLGTALTERHEMLKSKQCD